MIDRFILLFLKHLEDTYPKEKVLESLGLPEYLSNEYCSEKGYIEFDDIPRYTIYGEGYGMKIQKGGNYIKNGVGFIVFDSTIAENPDYDAEGLVLKCPDGLRTRRGERIIFKIKTCDFVKLNNHQKNK